MHVNRTHLVGALVTVGLIVPATALAATIDGGPAGERLRGTRMADVINGHGGNDRILGFGGPDRLSGDEGRDRVFGGRGDDLLSGGEGRDRLFGGRGNDVSAGGGGNDRLVGGPGDDRQDGGPGDDVLWALARHDVRPGPGGGVDQVGDTLDGGPGDDRLNTRDGEVDRITCGPGQDVARLDQVDVITDATAAAPQGSCERVERRAPRPRR